MHLYITHSTIISCLKQARVEVTVVSSSVMKPLHSSKKEVPLHERKLLFYEKDTALELIHQRNNYRSHNIHRLLQDKTWSLLGKTAGTQLGAVSLLGDDNVLAIGSTASNIQIIKRDSNINDYVQLGDNIVGEDASDYSGNSVSLLSNKNVVAIGATKNSGNGAFSGHVWVVELNGSSWVQKGNGIVGEAAYDYVGSSVSISSNKNVVATGAPANSGNGEYT